MQAGIGYYDHHVLSRGEQDVDRCFEEASRAVQGQPSPFLTLDNLLVVMDFKNPAGRRKKARAEAEAQKDKIEELTGRAIALAGEESESADRKAVATLVKLRWVVPTASAILAMAMPLRFGVIDRLIMGEIGRAARFRLFGTQGGSSPALVTLTEALILWAEGNQLESFVRYTRGLRQRGAELPLSPTPRSIDKALWGWAEEARGGSL